MHENNVFYTEFFFLDHWERFGSWQELVNAKVHMCHSVVLQWLSVFYFGHNIACNIVNCNLFIMYK